MILLEVRFIHYSPKDSEEGIKELLIANDEAQSLDYIDDEHLLGMLKEDPDEGHSHSPSDEWWKENPTKKEEVIAAGLTIDEYGCVEGTNHAITRWLKATTWQEADDCYYGVTQWDWSRSQTIDPAQAATLIELGIVKDIRGGWKKS